MVLLTKTLTRMSCLIQTCLDSGCHQKALRNWYWLLKLIGSPLQKWPGTWLGHIVCGKEQRLRFLEMARKELQDIMRGPQELEEFSQTYRYWRQRLMATYVAWLLCPERLLKLNWGFLIECSKGNLKIYLINGYLVFMQIIRPN